jgi:predicted AlkP superfamily phosphohydrolase/phosphomutase
MFRYLGQEPWDLFVAHIMDTDRLHHFLWGEMEDENQVFLPWFYRFYERIDQALGELAGRLDEDVLLMILSDHGFCRLKKEVHLNYWLRHAGFLQFANKSPKQLRDLAPSTRCYSLLPGRFYVCVQGRERNGCVSPGDEYEAVRKEISEGLLAMRDPDSGDRVISQVLMREDVYAGDAFEVAPDFLAVPAKGFDLKGGFEKEVLTETSPVTGTHTLDDAMFYMNRSMSNRDGMQVVDVMPTLMDGLGVEIPHAVDGQSRMGKG